MTTPHGEAQIRFWKLFLTAMQARWKWGDIDRRPAPKVLFSFSAKVNISDDEGREGKRYTQYHARITNKEMSIGLNIPYKNSERNSRVWDLLHEDRQEIESAFGQKLQWRSRADRIQRQVMLKATADFSKEDSWPKYVSWLVENLVKFDEAIRPFLFRAHEGTQNPGKDSNQ